MQRKNAMAWSVLLSGLLMLLLPCRSVADDAAATAAYLEGKAAYDAGRYHEAGGKFEEAELQADSPAIKANSVRAQIASWQMSSLPYREFQAIEKLLSRYPEYADFGALVSREYELAEAYCNGVRDPAYWALRWIPWLTGPDRSVEIFTAALGHAPFAAESASARLRLAYLYDQEGKIPQSLDELRRLIREYPDSPECKYAYLALGTGLFQLARRGDGDGRYIRESYEVFRKFQERYPDAPENDWVKRHLLQSQDIQAARLYEMAEYYEKNGRKEAAERYLAQVLKEYPDSMSADVSEALLVKLDRTIVPDDFRPDPESRMPEYQAYELPKEATRLLIAPEQSNRKYLLPVYNLQNDAQAAEGTPEAVTATEVAL